MRSRFWRIGGGHLMQYETGDDIVSVKKDMIPMPTFYSTRPVAIEECCVVPKWSVVLLLELSTTRKRGPISPVKRTERHSVTLESATFRWTLWPECADDYVPTSF